MGYNLHINEIYYGYNPLILTSNGAKGKVMSQTKPFQWVTKPPLKKNKKTPELGGGIGVGLPKKTKKNTWDDVENPVLFAFWEFFFFFWCRKVSRKQSRAAIRGS